MGNCTGVFGACVGEDPKAIQKVNKDGMAKALQANKEMKPANFDLNDAS